MNKKYVLPSATGGIVERFSELCEIQPLEYIPEIRKHVGDVYANLEKYKDDFMGPNLKLAQEIVNRCNLLLDRYQKFSDQDKKQVIGAVRYFIVHMDTMPDHTPIVGLEDDQLVLNHVLENLGMTSDYIE